MNYALDAIWWRLRHPAVRDLASLLTAPPLWHSGCELPIPRLLGSQGFRFLLNLDSQPAPLQQWLEQEAPFGHRLGHYAESLLAFWLAHAPHCQLIARNHPIRSESGQTLGAADFLCLLDSTPYHLELTCKYYGGDTPQDLSGLNPTDTLLSKAAKLQQQCLLLHTTQARAQLPEPFKGYLKTSEASFCEAKTSKAGFYEAKTNEASPSEANTGTTDCRQPPNLSQALTTATIIRGTGFTPNGNLNGSPLNPLGWSGLLLRQWANYPAQAAQRFHPLPRLAYLAPARVPFEQTITAAELARQAPGLIAVVEPRPDGIWHETQRLMCRG
ncbi:hypothetical protein A7Q02_08500 [Eikenella sp. NML97-A-109]|uniref:DUF1853 family protein n=1 Tax=Eikenella sp. NML97-A-109 TaxID=1795833 RepID=UPI0007E01F1B|nr:DUF1853 family protein [Eikenella sp. NML97-A-109]OAM41327.1 hypothetical protein A7Q02_08500 [Eikenella sp. NML97-A-109]